MDFKSVKDEEKRSVDFRVSIKNNLVIWADI